MGNRRVVCHAPGRPDSPSPALHHHVPSNPTPRSPLKMKCMRGVNNSWYLWIAWQLNLDATDLAFCLVTPKLLQLLEWERGWYQGRIHIQQDECPCLEEES
eukprot:1142979-Pelagomonas_calceolata.AAC.1